MSLNRNRAGRKDGRHISGYHTLLSAASYYAQVTDSNQIALAVTKEQVEAIPNTHQMLESMASTISLLNPEADIFHILIPFSGLSKADIVSLGDKHKVPFELTWSCLNANDLHCGTCVQCAARKEAFTASGVQDPTDYLS